MSDTFSEELNYDDQARDLASEFSDESHREIIESYFDVYNDDEADNDEHRGGGGGSPGKNGIGSGRRNRKQDELLKTVDKGFAVLAPKSKNPIAYFHTDSNPGSTIRNAVTGQYETGYKFGSVNQDLFFKVGQASPTGSVMHMLFYDSPEQYEKHFHTTLHADIKSKWSEKSTHRRTEQQRQPLTTLATVVH